MLGKRLKAEIYICKLNNEKDIRIEYYQKIIKYIRDEL